MFLQFEVWKDCDHGCKFCFNQGIPVKRNKEASLEYVLKVLREDTPADRKFNAIGLSGGEFFNGQLTSHRVKERFYEVMDTIVGFMKMGRCERGMLTTALMCQHVQDLNEFCQFLVDNDVDDRFLLCTSWDSWGRFDGQTLKFWENNVTNLHAMFPRIRLHVEIIMTQHFIDLVLAGKFSVSEFQEKWGCRVDFNTPYLPFLQSAHMTKEDMARKYPDFFPTRASFLEFLRRERDGGKNLTDLLDIQLHSSCLHYTLDDQNWIVLPERHKIGHTCTNLRHCVNNCCGYIDSPKRMRDDIRHFLEIYS